MTVFELIDQLKDMPQSAVIMLPGHFDGNHEDHFEARSVESAMVRKHDTWRGTYEERGDIVAVAIR